jgi:ribose 5-phosphate isomerase B
MIIGIGSDHRGYKLKQALKKYLIAQHHEVRDFGSKDEQPVDYPDIALTLAETVKRGEIERGILICGSGLGMTIAANKVKGVRAALCSLPKLARRAREHNDANILVLAGDFIRTKQAKLIVGTFLTTPFSGERHQRRIDKIAQYEEHQANAT